MKLKKTREYIRLKGRNNKNVDHQLNVELFGGESFKNSEMEQKYTHLFSERKTLKNGTKIKFLEKGFEKSEEISEEEVLSENVSVDRSNILAQIFLVDMSDEKSFERIKKAFSREEKKDTNPFGGPHKIMIGIKLDEEYEEGMVEEKDVCQFAEKHQIDWEIRSMPADTDDYLRFNNMLGSKLNTAVEKRNEISTEENFEDTPDVDIQEFIDNLKKSEGYRGLSAHAEKIKDPQKREAVKNFLSRIDNAKDLEDLKNTILEGNHSDIIQNTGCGFYSLLGCITGGAQSTSHKHLMQLQSDFEQMHNNKEKKQEDEDSDTDTSEGEFVI